MSCEQGFMAFETMSLLAPFAKVLVVKGPGNGTGGGLDAFVYTICQMY